MRKENLSINPKIRDLILISLFVLVGGPAGAKTILKIAERYAEKKFVEWKGKNIKLESLRVTLSRLQRDGLVKMEKRGFWNVTKKGAETIKTIEKSFIYQQFREKHKNKHPDTLIIFDVPENQRKKRAQLRFELVALDFTALQKSVWVGASPLPKEFIQYLESVNLLPYIHIFSIKKYGTIRQKIY